MSKIISQEEYLILRDITIKELQEMDEQTSRKVPDVLTCDDCPQRFKCEFAADMYNTNGDCLADK